MSLKESQLYQENGILEGLQSLPNFVPYTKKQDIDLRLYSASYTLWKAECDRREGLSREDAFRILNNLYTIMNFLMSVVALSILQGVICGTLLNFLIFAPYYKAKIDPDPISLAEYKILRPQRKCLEHTRKSMNLLFNVLYLALALLIVFVVGLNHENL